MEKQLVVRGETAPVPGQIAVAGEGATRRFIEFFTANIRNRNTRAAYMLLFDWLVVGQVIAGNPASVVRGPKHVVKRGKTPVLVPEEAHARAVADHFEWCEEARLRF